jgi:hypothetical protein
MVRRRGVPTKAICDERRINVDENGSDFVDVVENETVTPHDGTPR